jgi:hypothetical protein
MGKGETTCASPFSQGILLKIMPAHDMRERDMQGNGMMENDKRARGMKGHDMPAHDSSQHRRLSFPLS